MANIGQVNGFLTIANLGDEPRDLSFLDCLHTVQDWITIRDNLHLESTAGMKNLRSADGLIVTGNRALRTISGFDQLEDLSYLQVYHNRALEEIRLDSLRTVRSGLLIGRCELMGGDGGHPALTSLSGFSGLTKVSQLLIDGNEALRSAEILDALAANEDPEPLGGGKVRYNPLLPEAEIQGQMDALGVLQKNSEVCRNEGSVTECMYCPVGA